MTSSGLTTKKKPSTASGRDWHPHAYQKKAMRFALQQTASGLFLDPGLGKTSITLGVVKVLKSEKQIRRTLVIAPLRPCHHVWPVEATDWNDFHSLRVVVLHGKDKERNLETDADVYVINPEGLDWLCTNENMKKLKAEMLVVDESTKFKKTTGKRYKLLKRWLPTFRRRMILTGTPNPNGYMDLFGQIYLLDLGGALGQYITHFRGQYFDSTGYGGYTWILRKGSDEQIQKAIKPLVLRLDAEDYIKMPTLMPPNNIRVDLPDKARKVYDELEEEFITQLEGNIITAKNAAVASGKCAQVANGGLYYMEDGVRSAHRLHDAKTEALVDLVEELQGSSPLLVAYEFEHDVARIHAALGKDIPVMGQGVSAKNSLEIERAWNAGELPVLLGHPASMGHGLNMQKSGNHICWYGIPWNFELYDQMIRRIRRQGSKHSKVFVHHLIARNTVDEAKLRALNSKDKTQKGLLDALRGYVRSKK